LMIVTLIFLLFVQISWAGLDPIFSRSMVQKDYFLLWHV